MEHYLLKGVTDALFLYFETTTLELPAKTMQGGGHGGVSYTLRSVREARVASTHTLRVFIYSFRGCLLWLFLGKVVVDLEVEQADVKHPRFSFVVIT